MRPPATRWVNVRTGGLMQPPDGSPRQEPDRPFTPDQPSTPDRPSAPDRRSKSYADRGSNGSLGATRASADARRHASGAQSHLTAQAAHERGRGRRGVHAGRGRGDTRMLPHRTHQPQPYAHKGPRPRHVLTDEAGAPRGHVTDYSRKFMPKSMAPSASRKSSDTEPSPKSASE